MNITENTRIIDLTVGQLIDLFANMQKKVEKPVQSDYSGDNFLYGYKGLAAFLGCSETTVYNQKEKGAYNGSIVRNGRKILFDKQKLMQILGNN